MRVKGVSSQEGFSLVELLISIAILGILAVFIITIATQMLTLTMKIQSRDVALSLAQAKIEEMRSNLTIPEFLQDEPKPGYIRTVTSTYVLENGQIVRFLRHVTVAVKTPTVLGARLVQLETNIQTYRPQVYFTFPEIGESYVRHYVSENPPANLHTYLEGEIRDDAFDIPKSSVKYRTRVGNGTTWQNWTDWAQLSGSGVGEIYTDPGPFHSSPATATLLMGTTYYFQFKINGSSSDGGMIEIQIQATNTNSISNVQPNAPQGGTSYIRLITDNTAPQFSSVNGLPTTQTVTTGTEFQSGIQAAVLDPIASGVASEVYVVYTTISKTPSPAGSPTLYWKLNENGTPTWTSTANPGGPYYLPMTYDGLLGKWILTPSYTASVFAQYEPFTSYQIKLCAVDKVKGKRNNYQELIPIQGAQFGLTQQDPSDPASGTLPYAWVDTVNNKGAVNANFTATTFVLTMYPKPSIETSAAAPLNPTKTTLYGKANSYGLASEVWFEYGLNTNYGYSTQHQPFSSTSTVVYLANISDLSPNTTYHYRTAIKNDWGVFYGEDKTFLTPNQDTSPAITVIIPNGGETWNVNSTVTIYWTYYNVSGNVKIELSRDGGATWETIIASTPIDDGQEPWTVTGFASSNCLIRITSTTNSSIYDVSDGPFTIY